jgi:serine/threonine protein phosphatase PrpC
VQQDVDGAAATAGTVAFGEEEQQELSPKSDDSLLGFWREQAEPLEPMPLETTIGERYTVAKVLDVQSNEIRYLAHDWGQCWQCGFEGNEPSDEFCSQCGAALDRSAEIHLVEAQSGQAMPSSGEPVVARLTQFGRHFLVLGEPQPQSEMAGALEPLSTRLLVGQRSDQGQVRDLDEDSLFALTMSPTYESRTAPVLGLFAVADGMGGYEGGEVASRLTIQTLVDEVLRTIILPELAGEMMLEEDVVVRLRQATVAANDDVYLTRKKGGNDMGTTLTVALVRDDRLFLSHVGDSRAYRWNADGLEQLTTDHSVVASMIAEGRAEPEDIYTHPHRSVIYRCIGDKPVVEVDTDVLPLTPSDRLVLCCDGLWEMVRDEGIEDVMMQESDPQRACNLLVRRANAAGGDDNISVIVVQVEEV